MNIQLQSVKKQLQNANEHLEIAAEQLRSANEAKEKGDRELWPRLVAEHQIAIAGRLAIEECGKTQGKADPEVCYKIDKVTQRFIFNENVLFEKGHSEIKEKGKSFLRAFCPKLSHALIEERKGKPWRLDPEIQIEGHSDTTGSAVTNWTLSGERALNVVTFITQETLIAKGLQEQLSLAGYSYNRPLQAITWNKDQPRNRRFEMHLVYRSDPSRYPKDNSGFH